MATLQAVFDDTRSHVAEATARQWTDAELVRWINEGVRDINRKSETNLTKVDKATTANVQDLTLTESIARLHKLEWTPDSFATIYPLDPRSRYEMDVVWGTRQANTYAYPHSFTTSGQPPALKVTMFPVPSQNGSLRVYYYPMPADMAYPGDAAVAVSLPTGWEDLVPLYAEFVAKRRANDPTWQEAKALYQERLEEFKHLTRSWHDQAGSWTVGTQVYPGWLVGE